MHPKRRLILLLDGTWNGDEDVDQDTNIVRLRQTIASSLVSGALPADEDKEVLNESDSGYIKSGVHGKYEYLLLYGRGVGTGPGLNRLLGGVAGEGLDLNVRQGYKFLSRYYNSQTEIFIIGFSRGAYTARSLVGYVAVAGLLKRDLCTPEMEEKAWRYYLATPNDRLPRLGKELKKNVHPPGDVRIACLGVFDTVGALGILGGVLRRFTPRKYEFHDVQLSPIVKVNLQALAIDEHRAQFEPSIWRLGTHRTPNSITEQIWFSGVHADIGGGYLKRSDRIGGLTRALDDVPLDWMIKRITYYYPDFPINVSRLASKPGSWLELLRSPIGAAIHNSRTFKYRFSRPVVRSIGNIPAPATKWERRVGYDPQGQIVGEGVHVSVLERMGQLYYFGGRTKIYALANLLINLPSLCHRYLNRDSPGQPIDVLSIVSFQGTVVDCNSGILEREEVIAALSGACRRLETFGGRFSSYLGGWFNRSTALGNHGGAGRILESGALQDVDFEHRRRGQRASSSLTPVKPPLGQRSKRPIWF